jgi:hypothetical protein
MEDNSILEGEAPLKGGGGKEVEKSNAIMTVSASAVSL